MPHFISPDLPQYGKAVIRNLEKTICSETRADAIEHVETAPLNGKNVSLGEVQVGLAITEKLSITE